MDDKKVEILTFDLKALPKNIDDMDFKKHLFSSHHVIKMDTQKDNITGMGTGMGRVQIRVSDPETQKQEIIERLKEHGIQAQVRSKRVKDWDSRPGTADIRPVRNEKSQQKKAEVNSRVQVEAFN